MTESTNEFGELFRDLARFRDERDWRRFHDPKSLALALVGEVGELAELLQWIPAEKAQEHFSSGQPHERIAEEMSDVLIYLIALADTLGVDLLQAARLKHADAQRRFPVEQVRGVAPLKE